MNPILGPITRAGKHRDIADDVERVIGMVRIAGQQPSQLRRDHLKRLALPTAQLRPVPRRPEYALQSSTRIRPPLDGRRGAHNREGVHMTVINLTAGMRFGIGIDSQTEEVRGTAIEFSSVTDAHGGQIVDSDVKIIESQDSLMEALNLSISASVRYGLASGDAKFQLAQNHSVNQYSSYIVMYSHVQNPARTMVRPRLSQTASTLYGHDPEGFRQLYGDCYIDEIYSGGDFIGIFKFEAFDETSHSDIRADLHVAIGSFFAGGEINASFQNTIDNHSRHSHTEIKALMSGGKDLQNPTNVAELNTLYKDFNRAVSNNPIDYKATIKEFRYLPLPEGDTWQEQAVRADVVHKCGAQIVEGISLRGDIEFVLRYPQQFELPDDATIDLLKSSYNRINATLPELAKRARDCAQKIESCTLEGIDPFVVTLPRRLAVAVDPIEAKWLDLARDERAVNYFKRSPPPDFSKWFRGPRDG
jgi:hypothetical protein